MKTLSDISAILRAAVKNSRKTQLAICEESGVQRMTLHRMLSGKDNFSMTSFLAVAYVLKLDLLILSQEQAEMIQRFSIQDEQAPRVPRKIDALKDL